LFKFITNRHIIINVIVGILLAVSLVFAFFMLLGSITQHGEYERVPQVTGKNIETAKVILEAKGFIVEVADSVFDLSIPRLNVMKQSPEPDALVKNGRTIYLTVNRLVAPQVDMPNLVGYSLKSAMLFLEGLGLKVGDTTFKPDVAKNSILIQMLNGIEIKPGSKVSVGSKISLVIGSGIGEQEMDIPDLVGLTFAEARSLLGNMSINVDLPIILDANIRDTAHAFVSKQDPAPYFEPMPGQRFNNKIRPGQIIDLYLSFNKPIKDSSLLINNNDSIQ
jgi:eukaryotic-like serine/threonine-protein kinase